MKHTTKKALSFILAFAMILSCFSGLTITAQAAETDDVTVSVDGNSVVIGNGYISREFSVADGKLSTTKIDNKRADEEFIPAEGSEEFIIRVTKDDDATAVTVPALDRTGWTATADSYQNASGDSDGPASNLLDGRTESIWHSNYGGGSGSRTYPYNVVITLNGSKTFSCFSYTPRQQGEDTNGNILGYELWYATAAETLAVDDAGWIKVSEGNFKYEGVNPIYVNLDEAVTATQVKLVATSAKNGLAFAGGAEFNLHAEKAPVATNDREFAASALELDGEPVVADTTAVINDVEKSGKMVTFNFKPYEFKGVTYTISEVVVMYDGDHFMRKYMEISVNDDQVAIDYIDLESLVVNDTDAQWTIPTDAGNAGELGAYKAMLGQPIYIQGMFFGCEFPVTDTQIEDGVGRMRYYTGKTFERFEADNQLTTDGKYITWQTVVGAARSTEMQVIQADFFEYIYSIATPSDFRIQYNSWFDNMMLIDDESILESFIEIDQELNKAEVRPLDSYVVDDGWNNYNYTYVVDANRSGTTLNESGFWEFNSKFPDGLTPSSELVQKFGSNFGVWIGPRGGYNFNGTLADILTNSGKGSKAGGAVDVADREYVKNFTEMACQWQDEYQVNYWKWDGFANASQYSAFAAADGVPGYANRHMTGGYQNMYHVTDLWEAWIDLFEAVRANAKKNGIDDLWISLTCYVNPSPWYLQWANSVWLQCLADQRDASFGTTKMNKQITYRDATYYAYTQLHQFQFPLANIYNHDPVYGKEGTSMSKNTATDEEFQNYLYMLSTRGTAFWELYYSDSIMTDGKYEVTGEFLEWAEENFHILRNAKMIGGMPDTTNLTDFASNEAYAEAYGFSCFDGTDGIISIRNPHSSASKTISITFDRTIGVAEDCGTLNYYLEHTYNLTEGTATTGEFTYGKTYEFTLAPNEVRIFAISEGGDTTAPVMERAFSDGDRVITVRFNEKVVGTEFTVSGAEIESVEQSADDVTYRITLTEAPADKSAMTVTANVTDISGNACAETISFVYNSGNVVATGAAEAAASLQTNYGFTVSTEVATAETGVLVAQGDSYALGINEDGTAYFTVNGATAVSDVAVTVPEDAETATIVGVKENNGILKIYVNDTLAGSAYKAENRYFAVPAAAITVSALAAKAAVYDIAYGYDELDAAEAPASTKIEGITGVGSDYDAGESAIVENAFDGDYGTYWATPAGGNVADQYLIANLGGTYTIDKVQYTQRYDSTQQYNCTGNLLNYVIEVSTDGEVWTQVSAGATVPGTTEITFEPVEAAYVRLTGTESYHWQSANANTVMCVAEFEVFEYVVPVMEPDDDSRDIPLDVLNVSAGDWQTGYETSEGPAELAVDNNENTLWHTDWYGTSRDNHWFQFELTDTYKVDGLRYQPRQSGNTNGTITKYEIQVSNDGENFETIASGEWAADRDWKIVQFNGQNVKYVRLVSVDAVTDNAYVFASAAEIRLTGTKTAGGETHEHTYGEWTVTKEATCTEAGEETRTCECGETETREIAALGHTFGEWTVTTEPTCTEAGVETATCECGETETREIPALGHTYDDNDDTDCNVCGAERVFCTGGTQKLTGITGEASSVDTSEPAYNKDVANAFDGDTSTFWATVETTLTDHYLIVDLGGQFTINQVDYTKRYHETVGYNCTGNLLDYIIEVSTDGESWTEVATGETVDGTTEITFEAVEAAYVRLTATKSYHWQEANANKVMTVAEFEVYQVVDAAHTEETVPGKAATCTETGLTDGVKCSVCGYILDEQEEIPALGHTEVTVEGKAATCTETGLTEGKECSVCGEILFAQEVVEALGHTEVTVEGKAATCTETGLTEGKECSVCGEVIVAQEEIPALGHDFVDGTCTRCGATDEEFIDPNDPWGKSKWVRVAVDSETIYSATEGNFEYAWDGNLNTIWHSNWQGAHDVLTGENTISGTIDFTKTHTINQFSFTNRQDTTDFPAYTTQASLYVKTNESDEWICVGEHVEFEATKDKKTFYFDEMEVRYVKFVAEKSSTMNETNYAGQTQGWVCISEFDIDYVPVVPCEHTNTETRNAKDATCGEDGYTGDTYCVDCGEKLAEGEAIPATGEHTEEVLAAKAPTCTETGLTEGTKCSVCGEILVAQVEVPALGHTEEVLPAVEATCTENGLTEGKKCSVCDEVLVAQTEVEALGHTEEVIPAVEATCTENGLTEGTKCSVCDEVLVAQEVVEALGHSWKGTGCENCDATRENPFTDVPEDSFYIDPVLWAVEKGITTGTTATTYDPNGQCMRAVVVTFLWRAAGSPEPTTDNNPFTDVKAGDFYYNAVLWAVENGITNGISATEFGPTALCNRAQVVTFLWRAMGEPEPTTSENPFTDVVVEDFYGKAVLWAVENGITNGMGDGTFGINGICNRAQVVTFLYRTLAE